MPATASYWVVDPLDGTTNFAAAQFSQALVVVGDGIGETHLRLGEVALVVHHFSLCGDSSLKA
ncbi:MAG: hypothetical protein ACKOPS_19835 [Cyanobium sp.]